jgi:hypothetical protein
MIIAARFGTTEVVPCYKTVISIENQPCAVLTCNGFQMRLRWVHSGTGRLKMPQLCYTKSALSDLVVSGGLPVPRASLPGTDFPKPLQRNHLGSIWSSVRGVSNWCIQFGYAALVVPDGSEPLRRNSSVGQLRVADLLNECLPASPQGPYGSLLRIKFDCRFAPEVCAPACPVPLAGLMEKEAHGAQRKVLF